MTQHIDEAALEAALLAMAEVDQSSRGEHEARTCLCAAISAYLTASGGGWRPTQRDEGKIWSAIRAGLSMCHEDMRKAVEADRYVTASVYEDKIARKLADRVTRELAPPGTARHARQAQRGMDARDG